MADNLSITPGAGALVRTNQGSSSGAHMQVIKLAESTAGSETLIPATAANGVTVDVTRVQGTVQITSEAATCKVDASGANVPVVNAPTTTMAVSAPATGPVAVRLSSGTAFVDTIPVTITDASVTVAGTVAISGTPSVAQSGAWNIATVTSITNTVTVAGTVSISGTTTVAGTVTGNQGTPNTAANAWPIKISDGTNVAGPHTNVGGNFAMKVDVVKQVGGGYSQQDKTAFTEGTTPVEVIGGVYNDSFGSSPTAGQASVLRITAQRAAHMNLRKSDGTEIGTTANPLVIASSGATLPVSGTVTAQQAAGNWNGNTAQVGGANVVSAAAGVQKVGISDGAGANFSTSNPLQTQNAPSGATGQAPWKAHVTFGATETDITIHTPAGGKTAYVEGITITPTAAGALVKVYDNTNADANMIYAGQPPLTAIVITPARPIPLSAVNNVLRYSTGAAAAGDITVWGYDA